MTVIETLSDVDRGEYAPDVVAAAGHGATRPPSESQLDAASSSTHPDSSEWAGVDRAARSRISRAWCRSSLLPAMTSARWASEGVALGGTTTRMTRFHSPLAMRLISAESWERKPPSLTMRLSIAALRGAGPSQGVTDTADFAVSDGLDSRQQR